MVIIGGHYRGLELSIVAAREKEWNQLTNVKAYTERSASQVAEVTPDNHACISLFEIKANLQRSVAESIPRGFPSAS